MHALHARSDGEPLCYGACSPDFLGKPRLNEAGPTGTAPLSPTPQATPCLAPRVYEQAGLGGAGRPRMASGAKMPIMMNAYRSLTC